MILAAALLTQPSSEMPKHWSEYPDEITISLFNACITAGKVGGYNKDKMDGYCTCHIWTMTEIITYKEFLELKKENKLESLFIKASTMCINMGFPPGPPKEKATPKQEPKPTNPFRQSQKTIVA